MRVDDWSDAYPTAGTSRIMFDELLDPEHRGRSPRSSIDDRHGTGTSRPTSRTRTRSSCSARASTAARRRPVRRLLLARRQHVTWPLGPSLVIMPNDPTLVATQTRVSADAQRATSSTKTATRSPRTSAARTSSRSRRSQVVVADRPRATDADRSTRSQCLGDDVYVQFNTDGRPGVTRRWRGLDDCEFQFTPGIGMCSTAGTTCEVAKPSHCFERRTCDERRLVHRCVRIRRRVAMVMDQLRSKTHHLQVASRGRSTPRRLFGALVA